MKSDIITQVKTFFPAAQYAGLYGVGLVSAHDNSLVDTAGNIYLDFLSGASAAVLGYSRADFIQAYVEAASVLPHSCFVYTPNEYAIRLADKLCEITPGTWPKKVMLGLSASDSVEGAIKAAQAYTGRIGVVSFTHSYHGSVGLSSQASGFDGLKVGQQQSPLFYKLPFPASQEQQESVIQKIESLLQNNSISCIVFEPILGDGGNIVPPDSFWREVSKIARKYSVVVIADETQSGLCRSGRWWAVEHFGIEPDLLITGKGLGAGYIPISAVIGRAEVLDCLAKAQHVFTYSGHPPSCAVALRVLEALEGEGIASKVTQHGALLLSELQKICDEFADDVVCHVRGKGLQVGLSVRTKKFAPLAALFGTRCLEKGVYIGYFGVENEVMRLHPPLSISRSEILIAVRAIREVFEEWRSGQIPSSTIARAKQNSLGLGANLQE